MQLKIGVLNPNIGFLTGHKTMHKWAEYFINTYKCDTLTYEEAKTYDGDCIVCFNGRPDLLENVPPKEFKGLKFCHVMDYSFYPKESLKALRDNKVQFIGSYAQSDELDEFFKIYYAEFKGNVFSIPFGYNDDRFKDLHQSREMKCAGLGAINKVDEGIPDLKEYKTYFKNEEYSHPWRNTLRNNAVKMENIFRSYFPVEPESKDFSYNIEEVYNKYAFFTTCESICNYPSVKVYEGMASGCIFIGNKSHCYENIGLRSGYNCILHEKNDIEDFKRVLSEHINNPELLKQIKTNSKAHAKVFFNPKKIATNLYNKLKTECKTKCQS